MRKIKCFESIPLSSPASHLDRILRGVKENLKRLNCKRSPNHLRLVLKKKKKNTLTSASISHSNFKKEISLQLIFPSFPKHLSQFILSVLQ